MPTLKSVENKLTRNGYILDSRRSRDPCIKAKIDSKSGKSYTHGKPGKRFWVDCAQSGRDVCYSWGADGSDWVPRLIVLSKKSTFTHPGKKLEAWLQEKYFDNIPHGYPKNSGRRTEIEGLDVDGGEVGSIAKAIKMSRLGR